MDIIFFRVQGEYEKFLALQCLVNLLQIQSNNDQKMRTCAWCKSNLQKHEWSITLCVEGIAKLENWSTV